MFLLKFFEQHQSEDWETTNYLLLVSQVSIRLSVELRKKVKGFMDKLVMTMQNMEEISLIVRSSSRLEIFSYFDQDKYLQQSLSNASSSAYLIKWAQCFLARSSLTSDPEKKRSKMLLKNYIDHLDKRYFIDVLQAIDEILKVFEQSNEHSRLRADFIDGIIQLCFKQSISS